jgi:carbohydrate kinase (thermoresistant glucokinase family)
MIPRVLTTSKVYFVFGVSGSGKTTIGERLAQSTNIPFYDADDYHPVSNIKKMSSSQALNDQDRQPWLEVINAVAKSSLDQDGCVFACSALKEQYRNTLSTDIEDHTTWIYLKGDYETISTRMEARDHFMPPKLLQSQFDTLEEPQYGITLDISHSIDKMVELILKQII